MPTGAKSLDYSSLFDSSKKISGEYSLACNLSEYESPRQRFNELSSIENENPNETSANQSSYENLTKSEQKSLNNSECKAKSKKICCSKWSNKRTDNTSNDSFRSSSGSTTEICCNLAQNSTKRQKLDILGNSKSTNDSKLNYNTD